MGFISEVAYVYPFFVIPITIFFLSGGFGTVAEALLFAGVLAAIFNVYSYG